MIALNIFFPTWFLPALPSFLWLIMLPVNFLFDSFVLWIWCTLSKAASFQTVWKKSILKVWLCGFAADLLTSLCLILLLSFLDPVLFDPLKINLYIGIGSVFYGLFGALIGLGLIYLFNRWFALKKSGLSAKQIASCALTLAVVTAPWLMMIPTEWLYWS